MRDLDAIMRADEERRIKRQLIEDAILAGITLPNDDPRIVNEKAPAWRNPELAREGGYHLAPVKKKGNYVNTRPKPRTRARSYVESAGTIYLDHVKITRADGTVSIEPMPRKTRKTRARANVQTVSHNLATSDCARFGKVDKSLAEG